MSRRLRSLLAVATVIAVLLALGAVAGIARPEMLGIKASQMTEAVHIYAGYFVSRILAVAIVLFGAIAVKAREALAIFLLLVAVI